MLFYPFFILVNTEDNIDFAPVIGEASDSLEESVYILKSLSQPQNVLSVQMF